MLFFMATSCVMCFNGILENFSFISDHTQSDHALQTTVKKCCEKGHI